MFARSVLSVFTLNRSLAPVYPYSLAHPRSLDILRIHSLDLARLAARSAFTVFTSHASHLLAPLRSLAIARIHSLSTARSLMLVFTRASSLIPPLPALP